MINSSLTVEEVMVRIKSAMRSEKANSSEIENKQTNINKTNDDFITDKLAGLNLELRTNNLKWNITTEWLITSHRKIIGNIIVLGKKLERKFLRWYINPITDQQREFNGSVTRSLNITGDLLHKYNEYINNQIQNIEADLSEQKRITHELKSRLHDRDKDISELKAELNGQQIHINELKAELNGQQIYINELKAELNGQQIYINELKAELSRQQVFIHGLKIETNTSQKDISLLSNNIGTELSIANDRLRRVERKINSSLKLDILTPTLNKLIKRDKLDTPDLDYFLFEQRFRGSREDIKKRQVIYLEHFKGRKKVLDIGCGRGEFIELMLENDTEVTGIDINQDMVDYCQDRSFPVLNAEAIQYLESLDDSSLGGIFAAQVVEHLEVDKILRLISLAYQKLCPSGILLLETVNLQTLLIFANQFYMDLTHNKPVHPQTLKFIFQTEGFHKIDFIYSSPVYDRMIPHLQIEKESNVAEFNQAIDKLNYLLYGPQDYAILGIK